MNVLMISGDNLAVKGIDGPFSLTLQGLSKEWKLIVVICPGARGFERVFNHNVHLIGTSKLFLLVKIVFLLRKNKYDLIVSHDYGLILNGLCAFFCSIFFKIPYISEIHHIEGYPISVSFKEKIYALWGKIYARTFLKASRAVRIDNLGDIYSLLKKSGITQEKILYLPPIYLDLEKYKPLHLERNIDVLFVGRFVHNKGIFSIIEALGILANRGLYLKTIFKGRGPLKKEIENYIKKCNLDDLVSINTNILDEKNLIHLYNSSKCLVCASTVEGGPRVTFEAMACGTPVLTTRCGIMPEVIIDGFNGYLFDGTPEDLADKLDLFFKNSNMDSLKEKARKSVLPYDFNKTLKNYAIKYRELVQ
jgi:glycosyltransferase involved in cell wall biosynthesis